MEWIIVIMVILWGWFGITRKKGKQKYVKEQRHFQFQRFKKILSMTNRNNLSFEGVREFVVLKKIYWSYQKNRAFYLKIATKDGQFEHLLSYSERKKFENINEGDLLKLGLIKHTYKPEIYEATPILNNMEAIEKLTRKNRILVGFVFLIVAFCSTTFLFMVLRLLNVI